VCGINGFNFADEKQIAHMNSAIKHRGPDGRGSYAKRGVSLGQVRLSIIDLSDGGYQPMFYSRKTGACSEKHSPKNIDASPTCIVFNGEIYNYIEVREELKNKGYTFTTTSDTEVILAGYEEWGFECVNHLNGMWAFSLHDKRKNILFLSRDRLGVKPLHYYFDKKKGIFIFSSEIKGILAHESLAINQRDNVSREAVELYFALGYIPAPWTIYNDVYKLEARQSMIFDISKKTIARKWGYYELPEYRPVYNKQELLKKGRELLEDSTKIRMRSDVPVGAFLSGGLDSSTIVGEMRKFTDLSKLHTFSIGFEGKYDESRFMRIVKDYFKTKHHHSYFRQKDFDSLMKEYAFVYDEPFGDYSGFATIFLSRLAKKNVTVSLSGDGGDEVFGGYNIHLVGARMDFLRKIPKPLRQMASWMPVKKNLQGFASLYLFKEACKLSLHPKEKFFSKALLSDSIKTKAQDEWTEKRLKYCLKKGKGSMCEALRIFDLLNNTLSDNFLVKVDRAAMSTALEVRSPFLDYRFAEYSQTIPTKWKTDIRMTKKIMREMIKGIVPEEIISRKKQGFTPPVAQWITEDKYMANLSKAKTLLQTVHPDLASFYDEKALKDDNRLYRNYRIRLYLFWIWWKRWLA
jgi:asparagine synthase (glutamine-hydrolysing)